MQTRISLALAAFAAAGACVQLANAQSATFTPLGSLPGTTPGFEGSVALGVSRDGRAVVGQANGPTGPQAFRWVRGRGMQPLGWLPGGSASQAVAVSADGLTVVGWSKSAASGAFDQAFRWTQLEGMVGLGGLAGGPLLFSQANAVSADGSVVVGVGFGPAGIEAWRWTSATGLVGLGFLPNGGVAPTGATAISADGSVIFGYGFQGLGTQAWRWTASTGLTALGELPGGSVFSTAQACNSAGTLLVGASASAATGTAAEPARWAQTLGWIPLATGPGAPAAASVPGNMFAVNEGGWVAAGQATFTPGGAPEAAIWDVAVGTRPLKSWLLGLAGPANELDRWTLTTVTGMSGDGTVLVGYGVNPSGFNEAFVVTVPRFCYANIDGSTTFPVLNALDFSRFLDLAASGDPRANCDGSTTFPALNTLDFSCFLGRFSNGCPPIPPQALAAMPTAPGSGESVRDARELAEEVWGAGWEQGPPRP